MNDLTHEHLLLSSLNNQENVHDTTFAYQSIFLSAVVPDTTNARFLPAILIEDDNAKLFVNRKITKNQLSKMYDAEDHVIIGKSCMVNCLKYNSNNWKKANQTIESIMELGNNISVSELIQAPTLYPINSTKFQILTGHRRFFSLIYANGYSSAAQFKVYKTKPLLTKVKQFQENASREELPQYGKIMAFKDAIFEIGTLNTARLKSGLKKLTVKEMATNLGVSMGAYDNYNVLTRYSCVLSAYESGLTSPFIKVKKIVLDTESDYKEKYNKSVLNITDKKNINTQIESKLLDNKKVIPVIKTFKIPTIKSPNTIKELLTSNIMELELGIDWDNIDWENHKTVTHILSTVVGFLENNKR